MTQGSRQLTADLVLLLLSVGFVSLCLGEELPTPGYYDGEWRGHLYHLEAGCCMARPPPHPSSGATRAHSVGADQCHGADAPAARGDSSELTPTESQGPIGTERVSWQTPLGLTMAPRSTAKLPRRSLEIRIGVSASCTPRRPCQRVELRCCEGTARRRRNAARLSRGGRLGRRLHEQDHAEDGAVLGRQRRAGDGAPEVAAPAASGGDRHLLRLSGQRGPDRRPQLGAGSPM